MRQVQGRRDLNCSICGILMVQRKRKFTCPNCGYTRAFLMHRAD